MFYQYQGVKIHYEVYGSGSKTILILPGWGETKMTFSTMIHALSSTGKYQIYLIDYPGFGKSPSLQTIFTIYDYASLVKNFLEENSINPYLIIAHSFGGRLAILLNSYYHLSIPKILLMDSAGIPPRKTIRSIFKKYSYRFLKKLRYIFPKKLRQKYMNFIFSKYASPDYSQLSSKMRCTFQNIIKEDLTKYLEKMTSEVLLIWGENDLDTPVRDAYIMKKHIKNSALILFENAGHFAYLDKPYLTFQIILSFIEDTNH